MIKNISQLLLVPIMVAACSQQGGINQPKFDISQNYRDVYYNILTGIKICATDDRSLIRNSLWTYKPYAQITLTDNPFLPHKPAAQGGSAQLPVYSGEYNYINIEATGDNSAEVSVNKENNSSVINSWANGNYTCN